MTVEQRLEQLEKRNKRLTGADLGGADLGGADLAYADLRGANLKDADLRSAILKDANLVDVRNLPELSAKQEENACWSDCG